MPKDKFKVTLSEIIPSNPADPLKDIKEAASFLLDVDNTPDAGQLDKDLNRTALIEIDGKIVWDNTDEIKKMEPLLQEKHAAQDAAEKAKIEQRIMALQEARDKRMALVIKAYKKLNHTYQEEKALFNLHQGVMSGAWFMLNNNYSLNLPNGQKIKGIFGIADSLKELKMKRENEVFSYELKAPAYVLQNTEDGSWWGIGPDGKVQEVEEPDSEVLKEQGFKPICEIHAIAKVNLSDGVSKPVSSFELEVLSEQPGFRYTGPKVNEAPEVQQLENVDLSLQERLKKMFSSIKLRSKQAVVEKSTTQSSEKRQLKKTQNLPETPFQALLKVYQEDLGHRYPNVIVDELEIHDHCKGGIKVEISSENTNEFLEHFQNEHDEIETQLSANPSFQSIAILFELNEKVFPLAMDTCGDLNSLLKLYKVSKFTHQKIEFSDADLRLLNSSSAYQKLQAMDNAAFRRHLQAKGELKIFTEFFEKGPSQDTLPSKRKSIIFDDIAAPRKKSKIEEGASKEEPKLPQNKTSPRKK